VGEHIHGPIMSSIALKLWFTVQFRAATVPEEQRVPAILFVDEFQELQSLGILKTLLAQTRSFKLALWLSHQNLSQLDEELLKTVLGNTAVQVAVLCPHRRGGGSGDRRKSMEPLHRRGMFCCPAAQAPDLVAYDYKRLKAIAIEVESSSECRSHREQVHRNMLKWRELDFDECHVRFPKIFEKEVREILEILPEELRLNVKISPV